MKHMNKIEYNEMMGDFLNDVQDYLGNYPEDVDPEELYQASDEDLDNWFEEYDEKDWI
jgi:hypothetical protein